MSEDWFALSLKLAGYADEWRAEFEQLGKRNPRPFAAWFGGKDRVYLPFGEGGTDPAAQQVKVDPIVASVLQSHGYTIVDYVKGMCSKGVTVYPNGRGAAGVAKQQQYSIGRVLQQIEQQAEATMEQRMQAVYTKTKQDVANANGDAYAVAQAEREQTNAYRQNTQLKEQSQQALEAFNTSAVRANGGRGSGLVVVISQNPHDVATMSTGRGWTSCMELPVDGEEGGSNHRHLFCEVSEGGFVAYLTRADDREIKRPMARVHIRRFQSQDGKTNIAMPEDSVYGTTTPGFKEFVQQWITANQGTPTPGQYNRMGGGYSDTFKGRNLNIDAPLPKMPTDTEGLMKWFDPEEVEIPGARKVWWDVHQDFDQNEHGWGHDEEGDPYEEPDDGHRQFNSKEEAEAYVRGHDLTQDDSWRYDADSISGEPRWSETDEEGNWVDDPFRIRENSKDHTDTMRRGTARHILEAPVGSYDERVIQSVAKWLMGAGTYSTEIKELQKMLARKYPALAQFPADPNRGNDESNYNLVAEMPPGPDKSRFRTPYVEAISRYLANPSEYIENWDGNGPIDFYKSERAAMTLWEKVAVPLSKLYAEEGMPEPLIQKLVEFYRTQAPRLADNGVGMKSPIPGRDISQKNPRLSVARAVLEAFIDTGSDTPTVQAFVDSLLPAATYTYDWNGVHVGNITDRDIGKAMHMLRENGRQFIPWMKERARQHYRNAEQAQDAFNDLPPDRKYTDQRTRWGALVSAARKASQDCVGYVEAVERPRRA